MAASRPVLGAFRVEDAHALVSPEFVGAPLLHPRTDPGTGAGVVPGAHSGGWCDGRGTAVAGCRLSGAVGGGDDFGVQLLLLLVSTSNGWGGAEKSAEGREIQLTQRARMASQGKPGATTLDNIRETTNCADFSRTRLTDSRRNVSSPLRAQKVYGVAGYGLVSVAVPIRETVKRVPTFLSFFLLAMQNPQQQHTRRAMSGTPAAMAIPWVTDTPTSALQATRASERSRIEHRGQQQRQR